MNNNKGNFILLMVLAITTLLVAVAGATFAYFGATNNSGNETATIEMNSGTLSVEYDDNSKIKSENAIDDNLIANKKFTVSGALTGANNLNYQISIKVNNNTYPEGSLTYTLVSNNISNNGKVAILTEAATINSNKVVVGQGAFAGPVEDAKHEYTLVINYNGVKNPEYVIDANIVLENYNG